MVAYERTAPVAVADIQPCWLCGMRLAAVQMVPDGGPACADVRWYCQDTKACTGRWTARRAPNAITGSVQLP